MLRVTIGYGYRPLLTFAWALGMSVPRSSLSPMSPIPGEPLDPKPKELTTSDGRKVRVRVPGLTPPPKPGQAEERGSAEPPREDRRPVINPDHVGPLRRAAHLAAAPR